jgi:hypothetical protein
VKEAVNSNDPFSMPEAESIGDTLGVEASCRLHWPEYLIEAGEMSLCMFCACSFESRKAVLRTMKVAHAERIQLMSVYSD